jgi:hypothetical protein
MQAIEDDERLLESLKTKGHRVLVLCNIDSVSMKLDHGATAEQLVTMGYKLFTDQGSCVQATMDMKPADDVTTGKHKGKGKQTQGGGASRSSSSSSSPPPPPPAQGGGALRSASRPVPDARLEEHADGDVSDVSDEY